MDWDKIGLLGGGKYLIQVIISSSKRYQVFVLQSFHHSLLRHVWEYSALQLATRESSGERVVQHCSISMVHVKSSTRKSELANSIGSP